MACDTFKAEFQKCKFWYNFHDHRIFYCSHWRLPGPVFVLIRVLMALYSLYALTHYLVTFTLLNDIYPNIMVYFTTWCYVVLTAHLTLAALLSAIFYKKVNYERPFCISTAQSIAYHNKRFSDDNVQISTPVTTESNGSKRSGLPIEQKSKIAPASGDEDGLSASMNSKSQSQNGSDVSHSTYESFYGDPSCEFVHEPTRWYFKLSWGLSDVVVCTAPIVTSIYFTVIYPYLKNSRGIEIQDTNTHILNSAFMLVDFVIAARPIRILHVCVPVIYGICWAIFSVIFWAMDPEKHVIYKFINWSKPGMTLAWVGGLAGGFVVLMFFFFLLYRLKIWLYTIIYKEEHYILIDQE